MHEKIYMRGNNKTLINQKFLGGSWLPLHAFTEVVGLGWIPGQGTKIPQAEQINRKTHYHQDVSSAQLHL